MRQYLALGRRTLMGIIRQPAAVVPTLIFPLMFLALSSASLDASTTLRGFPEVDSFFQFAVTTTIVQGALFGSVAAGAAMAVDIEGGFFERLLTSPVARSSILVGRLAGAAALGFVQTWWYLGVTALFGLDVEGGVAAMSLLALTAAVLAAGMGAASMALALKTGSHEAVQASFPLTFTLIFLSSAFFPRDLMEGWFKTIATLNPLSHLIEGLRTQVIVGFDAAQYAKAAGITALVCVAGVALAGAALNRRLRTG